MLFFSTSILYNDMSKHFRLSSSWFSKEKATENESLLHFLLRSSQLPPQQVSLLLFISFSVGVKSAITTGGSTSLYLLLVLSQPPLHQVGLPVFISFSVEVKSASITTGGSTSLHLLFCWCQVSLHYLRWVY